jgi:ubiquinone/menaquinone biosynthesis C-methylase UbiE
VASRAQRSRSFGSIAESYDRLRPSAPPAALDWIVPPSARVVVDVAAGTGLLTRLLADRVPTVVAVEPDPKMREVLAERSPAVEVLDGTGESIPLPDASADGLFVSSAWHWLDPERALPEIARVLRDGGRLGVLSTGRDRNIEWIRSLDGSANEPLEETAEAARHRRSRVVQLPDGMPFERVETTAFTFTRRMTVEDIVAMVGTYSAVITASPEDRAAILATARSAVESHYPGENIIDFPMRTWCWRADRVAR